MLRPGVAGGPCDRPASDGRDADCKGFLFSGFTLGVDGGNSCEPGDQKLTTSEECERAAAHLPDNLEWKGSQSDNNMPGGCYKYHKGGRRRRQAYFNNRPGSNENNRRPICKPSDDGKAGG
jgi:hypothetical protein